MTEQKNNLNTFKILYIVKGSLSLFAMLMFLFYAFMGSFFMSMVEEGPNGEEIPVDPGAFFMVIGIFAAIIFLVSAVLSFLAAKFINERRNHTFILVVAILSCFGGVLGILLGIFTIIEINKPEVKALFSNEKKEPEIDSSYT